jgi:hypothetical protein
MEKQNKRVCVYCGTKEKLTKDHIPPKNLFAPPRPVSLITVPCCQKCNLQASKDDEYFRNVLVLRKDIEVNNSDAQAVKPAVMRGYAKKKQQRFLDDLLKEVRMVDVYTPAGIYLGNEWTYSVNLERTNRVVCRIVKGLYYHHYSHRVPDSFNIGSFPLDENNFSNKNSYKELINIASLLYKNKPNVIGNDVFAYWHQFFGNQETSVWLLRFYRRAYWVTFIMPSALEDGKKPSESA